MDVLNKSVHENSNLKKEKIEHFTIQCILKAFSFYVKKVKSKCE